MSYKFYTNFSLGELQTRFIRNPNKEEFNAGKYLIYTNPNPKFQEDNFVAATVKKGLLWL
jgi:hypothetical protein